MARSSATALAPSSRFPDRIRAALGGLMLFSSACGSNHEPVLMIHPDLQPYFDRFLESAALNNGPARIDDLVMRFGPLENPLAANCWTREDETPTVTVDPRLWNAFTSIERKIIIFHELGHCVLGRNHKTDMMRNKAGNLVPESIMYPSLLGGAHVEADQAHFYWELFNGRP